MGEDPWKYSLSQVGRQRYGQVKNVVPYCRQSVCVCGGGVEWAIISATAAGVGVGGGGWQGPVGATVHCCSSLTCEVER